MSLRRMHASLRGMSVRCIALLALQVTAFGLVLAACHPKAPARPGLARMAQSTPTRARLQAIMAVDDQVVWASGLEGSVLRTVDGGQGWHRLRVPDASTLQFRDVHAFDAKRALLLSSGAGSDSRIYKTDDGGQNWTMPFQLSDGAGFLDCFDFWDERRGIAYGDSIAGELYILRTEDGGTSWQRVEATSLPAAKPGEGGFAASGTCVRTGAQGQAWIGTGAGGNARVLRTSDWGATWLASDPPFVKGETAGIMSVVRVGETLIALGGDLSKPDAATSNVASSRDGGKSWGISSAPTFAGAVYGSSSQGKIVVAVGPKGVSISSNAAETWTRLDEGDYWSVAFGGPARFWVVGPRGRVLRFDLRP